MGMRSLLSLTRPHSVPTSDCHLACGAAPSTLNRWVQRIVSHLRTVWGLRIVEISSLCLNQEGSSILSPGGEQASGGQGSGRHRPRASLVGI